MGLPRFIGKLFSPSRKRQADSPDSQENESQRLGREGERLAARHLRRRGYKILYRNFRAPTGAEVDLVCRHRDVLVFVEVKTRRGLEYGSPAEAVTRSKQKLIARGAIAWLQLLNHPKVLFRFDVVEVLMTGNTPEFHVITDAFELPEPLIY